MDDKIFHKHNQIKILTVGNTLYILCAFCVAYVIFFHARRNQIRKARVLVLKVEYKTKIPVVSAVNVVNVKRATTSAVACRAH